MSSKAVNKPTDSNQKEKDINQKLQLFGIYHAFKNSKLPSVSLNCAPSPAQNSGLTHTLPSTEQAVRCGLEQCLAVQGTLVPA